LFESAVKDYIPRCFVHRVGRGLRKEGDLMPVGRGGARNFANLDQLALLFDFVNNHVPREDSHYSITVSHDYLQVVVGAHWVPTRIYWAFQKKVDPEYYEQQMRITSLKADGKTLPEREVRLTPGISLSRARKEMKTFNYRVGADHKDRCPTCYMHELHIKLGKDARATPDTKLNGEKHARSKAVHLERSWRAYELSSAEREACLKQNVELEKGPALKCTCGHPVGICKCLYRTRDGFVHMQMDKGSKLGLPLFEVSVLWYKSRMWIIVEHVTDTSLRGKRRRTAYMWEEATAGGGSANMISVLYHHLRHNCSGRRGFTLWLDNCWHELKNWDFVYFLVWLVVEERMFDWIEVKYYESGHSYMGGFGPDSTHSKLTAAGRKVEMKPTAKAWYDIALECCSGGLTVVEFDLKFHRAWRVFLSQFFRVEKLNKAKVDSKGRPVHLPSYRYFRIEGGVMAGYVQAYTEVDPNVPPAVIRVLGKNFRTYCTDDPLDPDLDMKRNVLRIGAIKGVLAAWGFMKAEEQAVWRKVLVGAHTLDRQGNGVKQHASIITEEVLDEMLQRVQQKETDDDSSGEDISGDDGATKQQQKDARKRARAADRKKKYTEQTKKKNNLLAAKAANLKRQQAEEAKEAKKVESARKKQAKATKAKTVTEAKKAEAELKRREKASDKAAARLQKR